MLEFLKKFQVNVFGGRHIYMKYIHSTRNLAEFGLYHRHFSGTIH